MENIKLYNTVAEYDNDEKVIPQVSYIIESDEVKYEYEAPHDYSQDYLTFRILSSGTLNWKTSNNGFNKTLTYSLNDGEWTDYATTYSGNILNLNAGDVIKFKATRASYADSAAWTTFSASTATFDIEGNIMSILYGDNFAGQTTLTGDYTFFKLFQNTKIVNAENLVLPATTLRRSCYRDMMNNCQLMVKAPQLPATTLVQECYWATFYHCDSLEESPLLLSTGAVPTRGYSDMFTYCANLKKVTCLAINVAASNAITNWLGNVSPTGTFYKNPSMTGWPTGASGIPTGWTVQDYTN